MKMKKFWTRGGRVSCALPQIRQCMICLFGLKSQSSVSTLSFSETPEGSILGIVVLFKLRINWKYEIITAYKLFT